MAQERNKHLTRVCYLLCCLLLCTVPAGAFHYQRGDLLFQNLDCGKLCQAIARVTKGYQGRAISHVGIVLKVKGGVTIAEAIGKDVHTTPLAQFLKRSVDRSGQPEVIVGRLKPPYRPLIPEALKMIKSWEGRPYNATFTPDTHGRSFYCSQLIYEAFKRANDGKPVFRQHPMTYRDPNSGKVMPVWQQYFHDHDTAIPQGKPGTNPAEMSRSPRLEIIYQYDDKPAAAQAEQ